ncbi:MAG: hypothetical protein H7Y02_11300 [Candidatus Obscuribacterales bacterium]|nr:hypothetical protein [Steroidobacteraceae bacterium]
MRSWLPSMPSFRRVYLLFALLTLLPLTSCGWQLRGVARLPAGITPVRIESADPYSHFYRELRRSLIAAGARVTDGDLPASAIVRVHGDATGQRILSVSARNTPEEYQVFYAVQYSVEVGGREVIIPQNLELTSAYSYDSRVVLAKQREQHSIQQALARELAGLVLRRLGSVKLEPPA